MSRAYLDCDLALPIYTTAFPQKLLDLLLAFSLSNRAFDKNGGREYDFYKQGTSY